MGDAALGDEATKASVSLNNVTIPGVKSVGVRAVAGDLTMVTIEVFAKDCEVYQRFDEIGKTSAYYCAIE